MLLSVRARSGTGRNTTVVLVILGLLALMPPAGQLQYYLAISLAFATAAVGLDIFSGYLGAISFGNAAFMGVGAYCATILRVQTSMPTVLAFVAAVTLAGATAALVGSAMVRLQHFGAALTTLFTGYVVYTLLSGTDLAQYTKSASGLAVPPLSVGGVDVTTGRAYYIFSYLVLVVAVTLTYVYANSSSGHRLRLIKRSEVVASALGVRVVRAKLSAFVYSAVLAAAGGFVLSFGAGYISPDSYTVTASILLFAMAAVGGLGSIAGPILGALFFTVVPPYAGFSQSAQAAAFAGILLIVFTFFPGGFYGILERVSEMVRGRDGLGTLSLKVFNRHGNHKQKSRSLDAAGDRSKVAVWESMESPARLRQPESNDARRVDLPLLSLQGVAIEFGGVRALDGISIDVQPGEIHAVIGPNGAGKTTLLNVISGIARPTHGTVCLAGTDITGVSANDACRLGVVRTFQNPSLVPDLSVVDNVRLGAGAGTIPRSSARQSREPRHALLRNRADWALDLVEIPADRRELYAADLTLGEQKLVDLARCIASGASLLLLDEPTSGVSEDDVMRVRQVLRSLHERLGVTIIVISHHVGFVVGVADRVTVLNFGTVLASGKPAEVIAEKAVAEAFLGPSDVTAKGRN